MTTTHRDYAAEAAKGGVHKVHNALPRPGETPADERGAPGRARAREDSGASAQSQPSTAQPGDGPDTAAALTDRDVVGWLLDTCTPPDIWATARPPLADVWAYAARGAWTVTDGVPRAAGKAYAAVVAFPVIAVCAVIEWIAERPARLGAAALLTWLLSRIPPLSWLI